MLSPSAHSHHGQTGFSRWSTSHLNSNQTSPSVSTRGSFTRGGLNASVISGYSTASTTAGTGANSNSTIRNSFRQPYLGWRSQEKLSQPRTPAERLASSLLQQQGTNKQKEQQQLKEQQQRGKHPQKEESVVTPEIQSSIIETPLIENSSVLGSGHQQQQHQQQQQQQQPHTAGDHYRFNAGRMNGVGMSGAVPTFSLPPEHQSPGSATLEDVLASLLGLPADSHRSSAPNSTSSNHTLQIEPMQARRRSEGDAAGTRKRNDSGGSMAISSTTTTTTTSGSTNQSGRSPQQPGTVKADLLGVGLDARIARRVSLDSAEAAGHHHRGHDYLKCRYPRCDATATLAEARKTYKSCHNCSHLYCSRECRRAHWERHRKACLHSRVSALCRLVLSTCKDDADTLRHLSALARRGYLSQGRGVVRILFRSPESADSFIKQGFQCLGEVSYVRWPDLLPAEMGPELYSELLKLSTEYKPDSKMLIYVAICVVSEAPGSATAPVKWERQLVSRCAKLKLCRSVVSEIAASGPGGERTGPRADSVGDVLVLSFNILSKTTQRAREQVSLNIQTILRQRGVNLRKHYPEVFQRLATFVEGSTDRFLPVTLHPRDNVTGRSFVCIIMPNYGDSDRVQFPVSENSDDRVVTVDVGADLGDDLTSKL
uniref:MYND-type domain-containing protein n=1 Tax=Anopheles minimus TaxID=112268 RepID=A0A182WA25_9DIPT